MTVVSAADRSLGGPEAEAERRLAAHPWVRAASLAVVPGPDQPSIRIVPSAAGVAVLRTSGKPAMVAQWRQLLPAAPSNPRAWRLVGSLVEPIDRGEYQRSEPRVRSIDRLAANVLRASLWVPYDLRMFEGHFAAIPIVPGMLQVGWALSLASSRIDGLGPFVGIVSAKFRRIVRPGMELNLTLDASRVAGELAFEFSHEGAALSLGRLRVGAAA